MEDLFETVEGDFEVVDLEEDAPLVRITFHNQAKKLPRDIKRKLALQVVGEPAAPPRLGLPTWLMFGFGAAVGAMFASMLRLVIGILMAK